MRWLDAYQPVNEVLMTARIVGKGFAAILPLGSQKSNIELGLGHIDADKQSEFCHTDLLSIDYGDLRTMPVHPYGCRLLPMAGLGYRPNMLAKVRQVINLSNRIKSLGC